MGMNRKEFEEKLEKYRASCEDWAATLKPLYLDRLTRIEAELLKWFDDMQEQKKNLKYLSKEYGLPDLNK